MRQVLNENTVNRSTTQPQDSNSRSKHGDRAMAMTPPQIRADSALGTSVIRYTSGLPAAVCMARRGPNALNNCDEALVKTSGP